MQPHRDWFPWLHLPHKHSIPVRVHNRQPKVLFGIISKSCHELPRALARGSGILLTILGFQPPPLKILGVKTPLKISSNHLFYPRPEGHGNSKKSCCSNIPLLTLTHERPDGSGITHIWLNKSQLKLYHRAKARRA